MFAKFTAFLKRLTPATLKAAGYVVFMLLFYVIGATQAQFDSLVAIILLTGFYFGGLKMIKKITAK